MDVSLSDRASPPCCHPLCPGSRRLCRLERKWGRNVAGTWGWSRNSQTAGLKEVKKAGQGKRWGVLASFQNFMLQDGHRFFKSIHTMRAGAELGRQANVSFDWQLLKERMWDRDTGLVGFLNSKPSWKKKWINVKHFSQRLSKHLILEIMLKEIKLYKLYLKTK